MPEAPSLPDDWTEPERWVWQQIAAGKIADLNERAKEANNASKALDPKLPDGWGADRRLRASYLQRILTDPLFVEATPFGGVRIRGVLVDDEALDLEHARLHYHFWLERTRIGTAIKACNLRVNGELSLATTCIAGQLDLGDARIDEHLTLALGASFEDRVNLDSASVGGQVRMTRASFAGPLFLNSAKITGSAFLDNGASFKRKVDLGGAIIGGQLVTRGANFAGPVSLNSATVTRDVFLDDAASFTDSVDLIASYIGGQLFMNGARFDGPVSLDKATVGGRLMMRGASFAGPVSLRNAKIADDAVLDDAASFKEALDLDSASIGALLVVTGAHFASSVNLSRTKISGSAFINDGATFKDMVNLVAASIDGQLTMRGASFAGPVKLNGATIKGSAFLGDSARFKDAVNLIGVRIGADLDLSDATFASVVDLTNARIGSELRLGSSAHPPARWGSGVLILRNTRCGALQDRWPTTKEPEAPAWPAKIDLDGFAYDLLGGLRGGGGGPADMRARPASSYVAWLARHHPFSPQPYEQLAKVLRASGEPGKANDVLYAARERQRREFLEGGARWKWFGLSVLSGTIGYGLGWRYFRALIWVALFTLLGTELLRLFGNQPDHSWPALAFASFDQLLPAITLDRAHEALFTNASTDGFVQPAWLVMYFYVHKLIGWLLGIFLLAGLAGLTQRS